MANSDVMADLVVQDPMPSDNINLIENNRDLFS